jgi:hypothetical protein
VPTLQVQRVKRSAEFLVVACGQVAFAETLVQPATGGFGTSGTQNAA